MVVAEIKPFWVDEWRVVYNLKFKTAAQLWGPMDFMQQFPRVYLTLVKWFTSAFDYSYFSLRFPAWLAGVGALLLSYKMMHRLFAKECWYRYLFVMIIVSSYTFTEYYVQTKHYTMDILLSVAALWQLTELMKVQERGMKMAQYMLLCGSFVVFPFFSYTYPVAIAPVFAVIFLRSVLPGGRQRLLMTWLPLMLSAISIGIFYVVDVKQLMADKGMQAWWGHLMMAKGFSLYDFCYNLFNLFAETGSGLLFWILFGIVGLAGLCYGIYTSAVHLRKGYDSRESIVLYSTVLIVLVLVLGVAGKLPVGEPRLNAFVIPSIAILMITVFDKLINTRWGKVAAVLPVLFYAGVTGNIYTTAINTVASPVVAKRLQTYKATESALAIAEAGKLPILITPGVAFPYDTTQNLPFYNTVPGDWVIKTFPGYKVGAALPVVGINDTSEWPKAIMQMSATSAMAGDGLHYRIVRRP